MARKIKEENRLRLVLTGPSSQPTQLTAEYSVVDGDLSEKPQRLVFDGTDVSATIKNLWKDAIGTIKKAEKLS